ncbi:imelysin family protein [Polyangium jinanense]|uniref:Imelysin family protein n=1 Tax=Polyangium jinanense TaxID=2829994 RepID=A0A9X3WVJ7_9BACT|nr:imelysin family protein [Polyangium jinanense]MDC3953946.1 imelysin family protein [Polyangium jinanense]MDC3957841.1 imelysin family protein [Polyangium jinanense]MDC3978927.1 imelysin family protein [Polyangium jinanense]MDC3982098.1 imelysin family protein [Polyangium jinanense]
MQKESQVSAPPPRRWLQGGSVARALLGGIFAVGLVAGCERIAFYSTGRPPPDSNAGSTTASSSTGGSSGDPTGGMNTVTRATLLDAIATCNLELLDAFQKAAEELATEAAEAKMNPAGRVEAQAAWVKAIDLWQRAEPFQFGPGGPTNTPGGQGLRDTLYSWPLVSRCLVEQNIVSKAYEAPDFGTTALINMRGLAAAEYLLFYTGTDNACSPATGINATGSWAALSADELASRKAAYASSVSTGIAAMAGKLLGAWRPGDGDFAAQLRDPGKNGSVYTTEQMALNAVSDAMFHVETHVKDLKLARPLGILDCSNATCPEAVESRFARRSRPHVRNNLVGFRMLMSGCKDGEGVGFDDVLVAIGATALAEKMNADVNAAIAAADAIPADDLAQAIAETPESVKQLHDAVKRITDSLKTEFVTVLDLELPQIVEGDND